MSEHNKRGDVRKSTTKRDLVGGEDYYINEQGQWVFTELYHLKRGHCCKNGCKHCPYGYQKS
ncbi:MAG: DUF5522 domain-containing protein [Chitinophagales bacterium]|nr:DUF5522 domain-containing protein [Chitinophagales bacterium]